MSMTKPTAEQVTFLASGVNAVERTLQDRLRETFNIKDFGAAGNDTVNDAPAIQAAINAAQAANGGVVLMPAGIYRITDTINLPLNACVTLQGVSSVEAAAGTRLIWRGADSSSMIRIGSFNQIRDMHLYSNGTYTNLTGVDARGTVPTVSPSGLIIKNVNVKAVTTGFYFNYGWYNAVYDCFAQYCDYGIRLGTESNNFGFFNCHIRQCYIAGIKFDGTGSRGNVFDACSIEGNAIGVDCTGGLPVATSFRGCYFEINTAYDIVATGIQLVVDGCFFNGISGAKAIRVIGGNGIAIRNNAFLGSYTTSDVYEFPAANPGMTQNSLQLGDDSTGNVPGSARAHALLSYPWLITASVLDMPASNVVYMMTDKLDASASPSDWMIQPGRYDVFSKRVVAAYLIAETAVVTNNAFRIRIGYSGANYDQVVDTTFTGTIAIGVHSLTLLAPGRTVEAYPTNVWRYNNVAGTSGTYRIALVLCP